MSAFKQLNQDVHILLAEDNVFDQKNLQRAFKKNGIVNPLHIANDGFEAYALLTGEQGFAQLNPLPRILLLDINMPRINGIELLKLIRQHPELKKLAVFVLTTSDNEQDIQAAHEYNVAAYIVKPKDSDDFKQAIAILDDFWGLQRFPF